MTNAMKLVVALEAAQILPQLDSEGAMYALEGVQQLEAQGWKFTPPPSQASTG